MPQPISDDIGALSKEICAFVTSKTMKKPYSDDQVFDAMFDATMRLVGFNKTRRNIDSKRLSTFMKKGAPK